MGPKEQSCQNGCSSLSSSMHLTGIINITGKQISGWMGLLEQKHRTELADAVQRVQAPRFPAWHGAKALLPGSCQVSGIPSSPGTTPRAALDWHGSAAPRDALREARSQHHPCVRFQQIWQTALEGRAVYPQRISDKRGKHDFQAASEFSTVLSSIKSLLICKSHPTYFHLEVTSTGINEPTKSLHFLALAVFTETGRPPGWDSPLPTQQQRCQTGPAPAPCHPGCPGPYTQPPQQGDDKACFLPITDADQKALLIRKL